MKIEIDVMSLQARSVDISAKVVEAPWHNARHL
jgi:hypothetical protein